MRSVRSILSLALALAFGCDFGPPKSAMLWPEPGLPRYQRHGAIPVPGGVVNAAGGNLLVRRLDLSIDTRLGAREVAAVWNSSARRWRWSFEMRFAGSNLVDASGSEHYVPAATDGRPVPGTDWARVDATSLRSLGGLVHEFGANGRLEAVRWSSAAHPRLEYEYADVGGVERLDRVRQCRAPGACALVYSATWDADGRLTGLTDRAGRTASFVWDAEGRLVTALSPFDLEQGLPGTRYEYVGDGVLRAIVSPEDERIEYHLGWNVPRTLEVRRVGAEPIVHRFGYGSDSPADFGPDHGGYITRWDGPDGERRIFRVDRKRRLRRVELPGGEALVRDWASLDVVAVTRPDGSTTTWEYVDFDEVVRTDPGGNRVRIDFRMNGGENRADPWQRPVEHVEDDLGAVVHRQFENGRLVWMEDGAGERTTFNWDAENMPASVTLPDGTGAALSDYGEHGHPGRIDVAGEVEVRSYDAVGNLLAANGLERHDARPGGERSRTWDAGRHVATIASEDAPLAGAPQTHAVEITWRSDGRPLRVARPGGGDHEWVYDPAGRLVERRERVDGSWRATLYEVDVWGRPVAETLPNGMRRERDYDASGFVTRIAALRDGQVESEALLAWEDGRLAAIDDASAPGVESIERDEAGQIVAIDFPHGERLEFHRDARGRTLRETYRRDDGSVLRAIDFEHDLADRPTRLLEDGSLLVSRTWVDGRLDQVATGNGLVRHFSYEPGAGLPTGSVTLHPQDGTVEATAVATLADPASDAVLWQSVSQVEGPAAGVHHTAHWLGPLGAGGKRLLAFDSGAGSGAWAYDSLGRLTAGPDGEVERNAEGNRVLGVRDPATGATWVDYAQDAAGFVTSRDGVPIAWTAGGRVAAVGSATFAWDALGRPVARDDGSARQFRFGGRVETDPSGAPLRLDLGEVELLLDTGDARYRHADFRGNIRTISDASGRIVASVEYGPYGVDASVGEWHPDATFAGGRAVGGLVVLGGRLHDPVIAGFLAPDPVLQIGSQFAYAGGEPVRFWDASGLEPEASPAAEMPVAIQRALAHVAVGLQFVGAGSAVIAYGAASPPALTVGGALFGTGLGLAAVGTIELVTELYTRSHAGGASQRAPSGPGEPPSALPSAAGPAPRVSLPPNPGCPCGDGLPGGGHTGAGSSPATSVGIGYGWGGFGGFGGF